MRIADYSEMFFTLSYAKGGDYVKITHFMKLKKQMEIMRWKILI